jgi:Protein of unknown function (DUF3108)
MELLRGWKRVAVMGATIATGITTVATAPGCGGSRRAPAISADSAVVLAASGAQGPGAAALQPQPIPQEWIGERLEYRLSLLGVEVGEYVVELEHRGPQVQVVAAARATGVAAMLGQVRVELTSLLDGATGLPVRLSTREERGGEAARWNVEVGAPPRPVAQAEGDRTSPSVAQAGGEVAPRSVAQAEGDRTGPAAEQVTLQVQRDEREVTAEAQRVRGALWDVNSAMMALRHVDGGAGRTWTFEALRTTMVWRVSVEVSGRVMFSGALGKQRALRLDGSARQLRRDGELGDEPLRRFSLWISADAARVPLRLQASTSYGDVLMELVEYTPAFDAAP